MSRRWRSSIAVGWADDTTSSRRTFNPDPLIQPEKTRRPASFESRCVMVIRNRMQQQPQRAGQHWLVKEMNHCPAAQQPCRPCGPRTETPLTKRERAGEPRSHTADSVRP
jgi:hypothetical protein